MIGRPTIACRLLPHMVGDGPANMALDEALLDSVAADPSAAVARTYEWSTPTLSLGYFQSIEEAGPRWRGRPVVRRPTGGGALWHDLEVTYAVVVPIGHPASRPSSALYRAVHRAIADRLRSMGLDASLRGEPAPAGPPGPDPADRPFLCFTDRDPDDIVFRGCKLVGSAQRRRSGAVLQHGSLLLGRSTATPELPGLSDLAAVPADPSGWIRALRDLLPLALGLPARADEVRIAERDRADELRRDRYEAPSWTGRR